MSWWDGNVIRRCCVIGGGHTAFACSGISSHTLLLLPERTIDGRGGFALWFGSNIVTLQTTSKFSGYRWLPVASSTSAFGSRYWLLYSSRNRTCTASSLVVAHRFAHTTPITSMQLDKTYIVVEKVGVEREMEHLDHVPAQNVRDIGVKTSHRHITLHLGVDLQQTNPLAHSLQPPVVVDLLPRTSNIIAPSGSAKYVSNFG